MSYSTPPGSAEMPESTEYHCEPEKGCTGCDRMLPVSQFNIDRAKPSGLCYWCKGCKSDYHRLYRQRLEREGAGVAGGEPDVADDEPDVDPASEEAPAKRPRMEAEHLYIMALSIDPTGAMCGLKVGRSGDVQQRALALSESMPFKIIILATFQGAGHVEKRVHSLLDHRRNTEGRGREWFHMPLSVVIQMVGVAMEAEREAR